MMARVQYIFFGKIGFIVLLATWNISLWIEVKIDTKMPIKLFILEKQANLQAFKKQKKNSESI